MGLTLSDAKARLPGLRAQPIEREADTVALKKLAAWCVRFSPITALWSDHAIMLEITGCAHLFGDERGMAEALSTRLNRYGYAHRIAIAGTPGAAHALAASASGQGPWICDPEAERDVLAALSVGALRLDEDACRLLRRFGLTRIGQLYGLDRAALARRFQSKTKAGQVVLRLDQALGLRNEPLTPLTPPPDYETRLPCPEPLASTEGVRCGLAQLTEHLCAELTEAGIGARAFAFHAFKAEGGVSTVMVQAARPVRAPEHVLRLFGERIDQIDPGFGLDLLVLEARRVGTMSVGPLALSADLSGKDRDDEALAALADRITARLGDGSVTVRKPLATHDPNRYEVHAAFEGEWPDQGVTSPVAGPRPLRQFDRAEPVEVLAEVPDGPPLQFLWRKQLRRVTRADGPERISPEWWHFLPGEGADQPRAKDYYRVEDSEGRRYWIVREGLYGDGRGGAPRWAVAGLFP